MVYSSPMTKPGDKFEKQEAVRWLLEHTDEPVALEEGYRYQPLLRALGSWLDSQSFESYAVIETNREFSIVLRPSADAAALSTMTFSQLLALERSLPKNRGARRGQYQDVLRALGRELDELSASTILLEQVEDTTLLTYFIQPPDSALMWKKEHTLVDGNDRSRLLSKAVARRAPVEQKRWRRLTHRTR